MTSLFARKPESDICATRAGGNAESQEAHRATLASHAEVRNSILAFLRERGPMTSEEVADALHIPYQSASARVSELKRDGLAVATAERRQTATGCMARVISAAADIAASGDAAGARCWHCGGKRFCNCIACGIAEGLGVGHGPCQVCAIPRQCS